CFKEEHRGHEMRREGENPNPRDVFGFHKRITLTRSNETAQSYLMHRTPPAVLTVLLHVMHFSSEFEAGRISM
uniref:hypothetical protein n=1 Tax=Mesotoga sp. UBA5557 TaxID=1946857 RepID=UPI0025F5875C